MIIISKKLMKIGASLGLIFFLFLGGGGFGNLSFGQGATLIEGKNKKQVKKSQKNIQSKLKRVAKRGVREKSKALIKKLNNTKSRKKVARKSKPKKQLKSKRKKLKKSWRKRQSDVSKTRSKTRSKKMYADLTNALKLVHNGEYHEASMKLFQLSHSPRFLSKRTQIKYILGLMLYQMDLNQTSAFQFINVIRKGQSKYLKQSLEKLSLAADKLGDDSLLNYAISKVKVSEFPKVHRDMLYYRIGEFQMRNDQIKKAAHSFGLVSDSSSFYNKSKYSQALAYSELNQIEKAVNAFDELIEHQGSTDITNANRVVGIMGKARAFYQDKNWEQAIENYRKIPRDTEFWHDTLFESSWAMLRSGKFRSALSNFQSLHSTFYENFYLPESLLLRAIVYLYICKYVEMRKVMDLFNKIYKPVYSDINNYLNVNSDPSKYFNDIVSILVDYNNFGENIDHNKYKLPFQAVRRILKEGDFRRSYNYIKELLREKNRVQSMPSRWKESSMGRYANKVITTRIIKARKRAGQQVRDHMLAIKAELRDFFEQEGFIRFEMGNSERENIRKKISGKLLPKQINDEQTRDFYIQDGFEYWSFNGEYWLDELGNYHYIGTHSCGL